MRFLWIFIFLMIALGLFYFGGLGVPAQQTEIKRHLALSSSGN